MKSTPKVLVKFVSPDVQMENHQNATMQTPSGEYKGNECAVSVVTNVRVPYGVYAKGPRAAAKYVKAKIESGKFKATVLAGVEK